MTYLSSSFTRADTLDVVEGPRIDSDLNDPVDENAQGLGSEDDARRDLHVMPEFLVLGKHQGRSERVEGQAFEDNNGNHLSRPEVASDEGREDVCRHSLVAAGRQEGYGHKSDEVDADSKDDTPPRELCPERLGEPDAESSDDHEGHGVPPGGSHLVLFHELLLDR